MNEDTYNLKDRIQEYALARGDLRPAFSPEFQDTHLRTFKACPLPGRKDEEWRYTPLNEVLNRNFGQDNTSDLPVEIVEELKQVLPEAYHLFFLNGLFSNELSDTFKLELPEGLQVRALENMDSEALKSVETSIDKASFTDDAVFREMALNHVSSGLFIQLAEDVEVAKPIHIIHVNSNSETVLISSGLTNIHLGTNSRLTVVQQYVSTDKAQVTSLPLDIIELDQVSHLDLYKIGAESEETDHLSNTAVQMGQSAELTAHQYLLGSRFTRSNLEVAFAGNDAKVNLRGIYLGKDKQHLDIRTYIDHAHPNCSSDQHFRGIMDDHSRGVFNGMVLVRKHAQKTDAQQSNKNLLLSRSARVDTKPQLEIFADDVKCAHGATVGELDETAIFYLRSRGISKADAALMLTRAFAAEITDDIKIDSLKTYIQTAISTQLDKAVPPHA